MAWWIWIIAGFAVLALELFIPSGFFLAVVGLSGIITGLLAGSGLLPILWLQWIVCALLAVVLVLLVRQRLAGALLHGNSSRITLNVGSEIVISSDIEPGQIGEGQMRGSNWAVKNTGSSTLKKGERYKVDTMNGITVCVKGL